MSVKTNRAAHFQKGTSDKVYVVSIRENSAGRWEVVAKWGKRRTSPQSQQVKSTHSSRASAEMAAQEVFGKKIWKSKNPYTDIDSSSYSGPCTRSSLRSGWFEAEIEQKEATAKPMPKPTPAPAPAPVAPVKDPTESMHEFVVVCVDNAGCEDRFDEDVQYVAETHPEGDLYYVYDKNGKKDEWFKDRFKLAAA
jgi:hypothetical protein